MFREVVFKEIMQKGKLALELKKILKGRVVIIGIGNTLRGDDGFGPEIITKLKKEKSKDKKEGREILLLNVGEVLENFFKPIIDFKPDTILAIDAVHMNEKPGEIRIIPLSNIADHSLSTHNISLKVSLNYLIQVTGAEIYLLCVQPQRIQLGEPISPPVKDALRDVANLLKKII